MSAKPKVSERKRDAVSFFTRLLLSSNAKEHIVKVILFGSLRKGEVRPDSDVDVLIFSSGSLREMEEQAADCALETGIQVGESVEPLVYCIDDLRFPGSYFLKSNLNRGEDIWSWQRNTWMLQKEQWNLNIIVWLLMQHIMQQSCVLRAF